jgi:tetratricopeptide (TPR) repeat protein
LADARFDLAIKERDYHTAERVLASGQVAQLNNDGFFVPKEWNEAIIARGLGDQVKADAAFLAARSRAALHSRPVDAKSLIVLAEIDGALGRNEDALREGQHAAELLPIAKDAINGAEIAARLTGVYAGIGMLDRALDELEKAAKLPNGVTYGSLKLDSEWDPLRGDPRFEKLLASLAPGK